jgi:hypothetical protein
MDSFPQKSTVTAQSVIEKIKSLSAKASTKMTDTTQSLTKSSPSVPPNFTESQSDSFFMKYIRYLAIFCLVSFLLLVALNKLQILPTYLGAFLNPYNLFEKQADKIVKKESEATSQLMTSIDKSTQNNKSYNIPEVKKISQRREVTAPTQLPQQGNPLPRPDRSSSHIQSAQANKAGYCYVGEDRGFRSCVRVKSGDKCMSGDIFPTQAVCINPNLRA